MEKLTKQQKPHIERRTRQQLNYIPYLTDKVLHESLPQTYKIAVYEIIKHLGTQVEELHSYRATLLYSYEGEGKTTALKQLAQYYNNLGYKIAFIDGERFKGNFSDILRQLDELNYQFIFIDNLNLIWEDVHVQVELKSSFSFHVKNIIASVGNSPEEASWVYSDIYEGTAQPKLFTVNNTYYEYLMFNKYPIMDINVNPYTSMTNLNELNSFSTMDLLKEYVHREYPDLDLPLLIVKAYKALLVISLVNLFNDRYSVKTRKDNIDMDILFRYFRNNRVFYIGINLTDSPLEAISDSLLESCDDTLQNYKIHIPGTKQVFFLNGLFLTSTNNTGLRHPYNTPIIRVDLLLLFLDSLRLEQTDEQKCLKIKSLFTKIANSK